jgi:hypothetical protein
MISETHSQTTIAISRKNHIELSELCKKGQTFDEVLTHVLKKIKETDENKNGQSKPGVGSSDALAAESSSVQTATGSDSNYGYRFRKN